ncbi:MAG: leucine-rich repeat protein, partial [Anaerostipes sp.]|nr:leucine-rich repeat protein [Anaerostipes sp.]
KLKKVTIGNNVTSIGKSAFYNCKKLSKLTIKSTKLKSVGSKAIKNIKKNAKIDVPGKKVSKYKKLFKSRTGYKKTMKIK